MLPGLWDTQDAGVFGRTARAGLAAGHSLLIADAMPGSPVAAGMEERKVADQECPQPNKKEWP